MAALPDEEAAELRDPASDLSAGSAAPARGLAGAAGVGRRTVDAWLPAALAITALALYCATLAPTVHWSDSAELQRVAYTLEVPHPTGYPLYTMLGRLWIALLPLRDVAWRLNLFSAVAAALAVGTVAHLAHRLTDRAAAGAVAGLVLATAASFWSQAIVAEVYALHALFVALLVWSALAPRWRGIGAAFLLGLGLSHHRMTVLLVPGLAAAALWRARRRTGRVGADAGAAGAGLLRLGCALAAGLSPYLLTWWRGDWPSLSAFGAFVLYRGARWTGSSDLPGYLADTVWPIVSQQLGAAGMALALLGLAWGAWAGRSREVTTGWALDPMAAVLVLGVSWMSALAFLAVYRVPDAFAFAPHFQVLHAVLIGLGLAALLDAAEALGRRAGWAGGRARLVPAAILVASGLMLLGQAGAAWAVNDRPAAEWVYPRTRSQAMLRDVSGDGVLVADWLLGQTVRYLQAVEGMRPDVAVHITEGQAPAVVDALLADAPGRPLYVWGTGWRDALSGATPLVPVEHDGFSEGLFRVDTGGLGAAHERAWPLVRTLPGGLELAGYAVRPWPLVADDLARLRLTMAGAPAMLDGWDVTWEIDPERAWLRHVFPDLGPWQAAGPDGVGLELDLVVPPAPFARHVPSRLRFHRADDPEATVTVDLEPLEIVPAGAAGAERVVDGRVPDGALDPLGARLAAVVPPPEVRPGLSFPVTARWEVADLGAVGQKLRWQLVDPDGAVVDNVATRLASGFTAPDLVSGSLVSDALTLAVPHRAAGGDYEITVAPEGADAEARVVGVVPVVDWPMVTEPQPLEHTSGYTLDDGAIALHGFGAIHTDDSLLLALLWRSVAPTETSWRGFVHLRDAEGAPVAERDLLFGRGWRPTNGWRPGEYIYDEMRIALPAEAGPVHVVVGLYDPATGTRAPIRDGAGRDVPAREAHLFVSRPMRPSIRYESADG